MKVLVTGAAGQIGREVVRVCEAAGDEVIAADRATLDVSDRDAVVGALTVLEPDVVIHTAAWTDVDACEGDPERAFRVNALGARHVAEGARRARAHVVHISTDYVFDGDLDRPYTEWDATAPRSVYGKSKLGGEHEILHGCPGSSVVRTAAVCGVHGGNLVKTILRLADGDGEMRFVDDQRGSPTFAADLAVALRRLAAGRYPGVFHATNAGATTWFGFAQAVMAAAGHDARRVLPIAAANLDPPRPAPRPANSELANLAMRALGLPELPPWQESLELLVKELRP